MIEFETDRIREEFDRLEGENAPLRALVGDLADFAGLNFGKNVVLTMIDRTREEQWALYEKSDGPKTKRTRPHRRWEAVDLRDRIYTDAEKAEIGADLKSHYDGTNRLAKLPSTSRTSWLHAIKGQAMHLHVQYKGPLVDVFNQGAVIRARPAMGASTTTRAVGLPLKKGTG